MMTAAAVEEDVALTLYALEQGYGGRDVIPRSEWHAARARLRRLQGESRTVQSLCDSIAEDFGGLRDAHLSASRQALTGRHDERCGTSPRSAPRLSDDGAPQKKIAPHEAPWTFESRTSGTARIAVMTISNFPPRDAPAWDGFDAALASLVAADGAIIDLRGSGEGDGARGHQLARALVDGDVRPNSLQRQIRQTPEALTLLLNTLDRIARRRDGSIEEYLKPQYLEIQSWREAVVAFPEAESHASATPLLPLKLGPRAFSGPVAVVVDSRCPSSCTRTLEALRRYPQARVFGTRTDGALQSGELGSLTLPNSGIRLSIPTKVRRSANDALYDKVGFASDQVVKSGADAFETALSWLETTLAARPQPARGLR
jgi:hypothetical protein